MLIRATEIKFEKENHSNVYVVGPTGAGKTRWYTIPNVKQEEKNIIVVESRKRKSIMLPIKQKLSRDMKSYNLISFIRYLKNAYKTW